MDDTLPPLSPEGKKERVKAWVHFLACCLTMFAVGWSDATAGPLLPRMQEQYHVRGTCVLLPITLLSVLTVSV